MKTWIVRCIAGGCVIGGRLEDDWGKPLTAKEAKRIARFENAASIRRRAAGIHGSNFEYYADSFKATGS